MENNENNKANQDNEKMVLSTTPENNAQSAKEKTPIYKKWWFWLIIGILIIVILCGSGNSSSNSNTNNPSTNSGSSNNNSLNTSCNHSYILASSEATCTSGGYDTYQCSKCNESKREYKASLGHTTTEGTCSRCGESFGTWEIAFYVDEFNNPTDQAYMRTSDMLYGVFSNSATTNSTLYARILIDSDKIAIKMWEYGSYEVNAYTRTKYNITILDDDGKKHYTTGTMYKNGDRIYLEDWTLVNLLQNNNQLKIYLKEDSDYGINSTYLFTVKNGNFNHVYSEFYQKYIK